MALESDGHKDSGQLELMIGKMWWILLLVLEKHCVYEKMDL